MGLVIGNRYEIQHELGAGGMGTVFLGHDTQSEATIAIKQLKSELTQPEMLERFKREGQALRDLNHPNIVKLLDALEHEGQHYLILEYIAGGDLRQLLQKGQLPYERCLQIAIDIADALTRAHRLNIIHRDLKPANVLVAEDDTIRLTDFGVAFVVDKERVTQVDAIVGTLDYLSPEAINGDPIDPRSDIWAFGIMLFEMLAGQRPFSASGYLATMNAILTAPIPDLEALVPDAPLALVDLVYRMLSRDPKARIRSVRYVGTLLEDILQGRMAEPQASRFETPISDFHQQLKHNLPAQTMPFVGRRSELAEVTCLIENPSMRLITIIGPGGMGKTRFALEAAERQISHFEHGVFWVELVPLSNIENMIPSIANALGYQFQSDERSPKQQVLDFLRNKELLLLMDNFEHLLAGAGLVTELLNAAPKLKILATSRQHLDQSGEILFHLSGMDLPNWETLEDTTEFAAVKLFINSAIRVKPDFELTKDNVEAVGRICCLIQGIPLGIVLAASWLGMLSPKEVLAELQEGLDFLDSDSQQVPERQRSMRAVLEYSWQQMSAAEQAVFAKLSVFRGGFTREAAEAVASASLRVLLRFVNKSLLHRDSISGRYEIHELLRQYAYDMLRKSGQLEEVLTSYCSFFAELVAECERGIKFHKQLESLTAMDADFENIRNAWEQLSQRRSPEGLNKMTEGLLWYSDLHQQHVEMLRLFQLSETAFAASQDIEVQILLARLKVREIRMRIFNYGRDEAQKAWLYTNANHCLTIARTSKDEAEIAFCLFTAFQAKHTFGEDLSFQSWLEEAMSIYQRLGIPFYYAQTLIWKAISRNIQLEPEERLGLHYKALDICRSIGNLNEIAWTLCIVADADTFGGDYLREAAYFDEAEAIMTRLNSHKGILRIKLLRADRKFYSGEFETLSKLLDSIRPLMDVHTDTFYTTLSLALDAIISLHVYQLEDKAKELAEAAMKLRRNHRGTHYACFVLCLLALKNSDRVTFAEYYSIILEHSIYVNYMRGRSVLFFLSMLQARHEKQYAEAVRLLALLYTQDGAVNGWIKNWPGIAELEASIKEAMGKESFNAAWQQGQALQVKEVLLELKQKFDDNYP